MLRVAIKSLVARKRRFLLTFFSVVLGVSFVAGTYIFTDSIKATFDGLFKDIYAGVDLRVKPTESEFGEGLETFPEEVLAKVEAVEGVELIDPDVDTDVILIDKEGEPIIVNGPPSIGFSWTPVSALTPVSIKEGNGRAPEADGEVVIDLNTSNKYDFALGDTVQIQSPTKFEEFEIVGLMSFGSDDSLAGAILTAYEFEQAQEFFDQEDQLTEIVIKVADGYELEAVKSEIETAVGVNQGIEVITGEQQTQNDLDEINEGLGFLNIALLAFAGVSIFVSIFIIQNTFRIIIAQRSKELALLRSIGATRKQITRMVALEAALIGLLASVAGVFFGVGLSELLKLLAGALGTGLPDGPLIIKTRTIIVALIVGLTVTLISALLPAIKASRIPPVQAMRDHENNAKNRSLLKRTLGGSIVLAAGTFFLISGLNNSFWRPLELVGLGAALMFIGVSVLAPLLARPFANLMGVFFNRAFKVTGEIAVGNVKRSRRRTASTASALMIGVALVAMISILASSFKSTIDEVFEESFPTDFIVSSRANNGPEAVSSIPRTLTDDISNLEELSEVTPIRLGEFRLDDSTKLLQSFSHSVIDDVLKLKPSSPDYSGLEKVNAVYVHQDKLVDLGKSVGDIIEVEFVKTGSTQLEIVGSFEEPYEVDYITGLSTFDENFTNEFDVALFANYNQEFTGEQAREAIDGLLEQYPILQVQDSTELIEQAEDQIDRLLALIWVLLSLAVIISVLGIANTLTLSISERQREIGMLRAIGMTKKQVRRTIRIESIIIALFGSLLGITMGILFGWALMRALRDEGLTGFTIPYVQLFDFLVFAIFAGVIAAWLPSRRAAKTDTLEAIKTE